MEDVGQTFRALADKTRRQLLECLREHPGQTLCQLAARLDMSPPAVSHHLSVLEAANLVLIVTGAGKKRKRYQVNPCLLRQVRDSWFEKFT